jgi:hypothetical protein
MIEICNLRKEKPSQPYDVRVDRQSILGNPFYMKDESSRDTVCNKYQMYFDKQIKDSKTAFSKVFQVELQRLMSIYRDNGVLRLFCWCSPKRCHAETIKKYILEVNESK